MMRALRVWLPLPALVFATGLAGQIDVPSNRSVPDRAGSPPNFSAVAATPDESFTYRQAFVTERGSTKEALGRLAFADVREETRLSSWNRANWEIGDGGVKVVGSRRDEANRREATIRAIYRNQEPFELIRGWRVPWLTLSMGSLDWRNYTIRTSVKLEKASSAGVAVRYVNSREYYAVVLDAEKRVVRLVLRRMDKEATSSQPAWDELQAVSFNVLPGRAYRIQVEVNGDTITGKIDDTAVLRARHARIGSGKVALISDDPAWFGPVEVEGTTRPEGSRNGRMMSDQPKLVHEVALPGGDLERDIYLFDADSDGEPDLVIAERKKEQITYRCLKFDGSELWRLEQPKITNEGGDYAIQVFDLDGDGRNEVVAAMGFEIRVYDGKTGKLLKSVPTPQQNPYFSSRDYKHALLLGDAICPVRLSSAGAMGFYIKDRYTNIWLYDSNLQLRWHKAMSTGHFPLPIDIDEDGVDEIMVNHSLLKADGSVVWKLPLSDHSDNIAYLSLDPERDRKNLYLASGEMGLLKVSVTDGSILTRRDYGHMQYITVADFLPDREGMEMVAQTLWREDQIHYLFDRELNLISTWQGTFGKSYAVPWGTGARYVLLNADGIVDPVSGEVLRGAFGRVVGVFADKRWGNVVVAAEDRNRLRLFISPKDETLEPIVVSHAKIQSHYLPSVTEKSRRR